MPERSEVMGRLLPMAGAAVLALSATTWIERTLSTEIGSLQRSYSLWSMLATVEAGLVVPLVLGIVILCAFVVVATLTGFRYPLAAIVLSALAALTTVVIMLNTDSGYSPGPGAWLTLVVTVACGVVGTAVFSLAPRRKMPAT